jgi:hypothetical protein
MVTTTTVQVDLTPLMGVLNSINASMVNQTSAIENLVGITEESIEDQNRSAAFGRSSNILNTLFSGVQAAGAGIGSAAGGIGAGASGIGGGIGSALSGLGAGLGGAASGIGMGVGAAGLGIGALLAGGGYFLEALENFDGEKVKDNVLELLTISESFTGGMLQFFAEGGAFAAAMTGIGIGLAAFGAGSAIAGLSDALTKYFGVEDWADSVKNNVVTLMSIADSVGGQITFFAGGATFLAAMTGIGLGLGVFGAGSAIAGIGEALARFGGGEEWSQNIKNNVITLMSIADDLGGAGAFIGDSATFLLAMTGIAGGLALFGAGSAITGLSELLTRDDWAQKIKDDVNTLMSIEDSLGGKAEMFGETGTFMTAMTGIGAGLAVFGAGSAITGLSALINNEDWALKIKSDVLALLSIGDSIPGDDTFAEGSGKFFLAMSGIAAGLAAFSAGQFVGTLENAVTSVLSFFTGAENPFDQLMRLADNADELMTGATALEKITDALNAFAGIKISSMNIDFEQLATDLGKAVPFLDALANGGEVEGSDGWLSSPIVFPKGILDPTLRLGEMVDAISKVNYVLGQTTEMPIRTRPVAEITSPVVPQEAAVNSTGTTVAPAIVDNRTTVGPTNNVTNTTIVTTTNASSALSSYSQFQLNGVQ